MLKCNDSALIWSATVAVSVARFRWGCTLHYLGELDTAQARLKQGERFYEAELYRLKGRFLLMQRDSETSAEQQAETCFRQALEVARHQQAKSLELRAAMNLSRLWQKRGKVEEARQILQEIYGWFSEGFDTADLKEAKTLLEALS